jgi:GntR family transcriptional regulator
MAQRQPIYLQIADTLSRRIESGELARGSQLPTELELRSEYGASRNTIRDAIKRLTSQGLIETRQGQGTFVTLTIDPFVTILSSDPDPDIAAEGSVDPESAIYLSAVDMEHRVARVSKPKVEIQTPAPEVAARLRLASGTQVVSRHQERFIDELPWSLQTSFYPMDFVTIGQAPRLLMADNIEEGAVRYLLQAMNLKQTGYRDWITARGPDDNEQKFFGIAHDATVFVIYRTGFDQTGTPMRVTVTIFPADRNQFIVDSGKVPGPQYGAEATSDSP